MAIIRYLVLSALLTGATGCTIDTDAVDNPQASMLEIGCDEAISTFDELGHAATAAFQLGPVIMAGALDPREAETELSTEVRPLKFPTTISSGGGAVKLRIVTADGAAVRLIYDQGDWDRLETVTAVESIGHPAANFTPCAGTRYTQFAGGFMIDGPACVTLEVTTTDNSDPLRGQLPLAGGKCP